MLAASPKFFAYPPDEMSHVDKGSGDFTLPLKSTSAISELSQSLQKFTDLDSIPHWKSVKFPDACEETYDRENFDPDDNDEDFPCSGSSSTSSCNSGSTYRSRSARMCSNVNTSTSGTSTGDTNNTLDPDLTHGFGSLNLESPSTRHETHTVDSIEIPSVMNSSREIYDVGFLDVLDNSQEEETSGDDEDDEEDDEEEDDDDDSEDDETECDSDVDITEC